MVSPSPTTRAHERSTVTHTHHNELVNKSGQFVRKCVERTWRTNRRPLGRECARAAPYHTGILLCAEGGGCGTYTYIHISAVCATSERVVIIICYIVCRGTTAVGAGRSREWCRQSHMHIVNQSGTRRGVCQTRELSIDYSTKSMKFAIHSLDMLDNVERNIDKYKS